MAAQAAELAMEETESDSFASHGVEAYGSSVKREAEASDSTHESTTAYSPWKEAGGGEEALLGGKSRRNGCKNRKNRRGPRDTDIEPAGGLAAKRGGDYSLAALEAPTAADSLTPERPELAVARRRVRLAQLFESFPSSVAGRAPSECFAIPEGVEMGDAELGVWGPGDDPAVQERVGVAMLATLLELHPRSPKDVGGYILEEEFIACCEVRCRPFPTANQ